MIKGLIGPTASGKTAYAQKLMQNDEYIIINADSRQVYKELPILCAMPENLENHYLYSFLNHEEKITVVEWALKVNGIVKQNLEKKILIVGGTSLYFKILLEGIINLPKIDLFMQEYIANLSFHDVIILLEKYDSKVLTKFQDERRLRKALGIYLQEKRSILDFFAQKKEKIFQYDFVLEKMIPEREIIRKNIAHRLERDFEKMIVEVKNSCLTKSEIIGFSEIKDMLNGKFSVQHTKELIFYKTCQYAKRQKTYINNCL